MTQYLENLERVMQMHPLNKSQIIVSSAKELLELEKAQGKARASQLLNINPSHYTMLSSLLPHIQSDNSNDVIVVHQNGKTETLSKTSVVNHTMQTISKV